MSLCSIADCPRNAVARGWCGPHYTRWLRHGDPLGGKPKGRAKCTGPDCDNDSNAKGMCGGHYARFKRHGDPQWDVPLWDGLPKKKSQCAVDDCDRDATSKGHCAKHHLRLKRSGLTDAPVRAIPMCSEEGCSSAAHAKGMCNTHYRASGIARRARLMRMYRMTEEDWDARFAAQGSVCPVCLRSDPPGGSWHVHHDHRCCSGDRSCGSCVIAILCAPCNVGMGGLGDDPDRLERAADLMRRSSVHEPQAV